MRLSKCLPIHTTHPSKFQIDVILRLLHIKVHKFWKSHKNLAKSSPYFCPMYCQSKVRFCKILWPSQNAWTLCRPKNSITEITLSQNNHSLSHCSTSNKLDRSFGIGPGTAFFRILRIYRLCAVSLAVNSANTSYFNGVWILFKNGKNRKKKTESFLKSLL